MHFSVRHSTEMSLFSWLADEFDDRIKANRQTKISERKFGRTESDVNYETVFSNGASINEPKKKNQHNHTPAK